MTPTIQCYDDHSVQMPPAEIQYDNILFEEHHQISESYRINSTSNVRTSHQCAPYPRNRNPTCNNKRGTPFTPTALKHNMKKLLENSSEETVSEEQLRLFRKREALLLVTIKTMTLLHENKILERKLSALHKRVMQIPKESTNSGPTTE